jgi:alanine racemase
MYTKNKKCNKKCNKNKTIKNNKINKNQNMITATINIDALRKNIKYIKQKSKTEMIPVLKANAYGHGMVEIAKILRKEKIELIGVATLEEALILRRSGDRGRILYWLYDLYNPNFQLYPDLDIGIIDENHIEILSKMVPKNKKCNIHLFVDTGINRAGIPYEYALSAAKKINDNPKLNLVGMMSHLIESEFKNNKLVNEQLRKFRLLRSQLADINIIPKYVHIANSGGVINYDVSDFTHCRPGKLLHGLNPNKIINNNLNLTMTLSTNIIQLKNVNKGDGIGYDNTYIVPKNMQIAVAPIGFADFLPRLSSGKLYVYINGTKRKVLGLESMDQIVIAAKKTDKLHDKIIIFGDGKNCPQDINNIAKEASTICSELLTHIGYRVNREYN